MAYKLFLDDIRKPQDVTWVSLPPGPWVIVRNFLDFKVIIGTRGLPEHVTFDHDLADEHYDAGLWKKTGIADYSKLQNPTGYDCAAWLIEHCRTFDLAFPAYTVHSMNPVGRERIKAAIEHYKSYRQSTIK